MKVSSYPLFTLREPPAEAKLASQVLMLRAGLIRKVATGLYSFLPFGLRVLRKVEQLVREEMNRTGALEFTMPLLVPKELLLRSQRWETFQKELFRVEDRHRAFFALSPTNEEGFTMFVKGALSSYRELPLALYQIQTKFRDEIRPRFGVMRAKEFVMKDAYSFHLDDACLDSSYRAVRQAYHRIFSRCALDFTCVSADSGSMGGSASEEFMVKSAVGEELLLCCPRCDYRANVENASEAPPSKNSGENSLGAASVQKVATPNCRTISEVGDFLKVERSQCVKTLFYRLKIIPSSKTPFFQPVCVFIRGDYEVNEVKLKKALAALVATLPPEKQGALSLEPGSAAAGEALFDAPAGFWGPLQLCSRGAPTSPGLVGQTAAAPPWLLQDVSLTGLTNAVVGANEVDFHLTGVDWQRDVVVPYKKTSLLYAVKELYLARVGRACPQCETPLTGTRGIEVGHIFKLGKKYSAAFDLKIRSETGVPTTLTMGCYGIGISRLVAAIIEQHRDAAGIIFPVAVAPFAVVLITLAAREAKAEPLWRLSKQIYDFLIAEGLTVLWDDRVERAGIKFKEADLLGFPMQLIVSPKNLKLGKLEVKMRRTGERQLVALSPLEESFKTLRSLYQSLT